MSSPTVRATLVGNVLFETYTYAPGPPDATEPHAHAEYLLCLSPNFPGEYRYRGARHPVPIGSLSVLHPGEIHSCRDREPRPYTSIFQAVYLPVEAVAGRPFFPEPVLTEPTTIAHFARLCTAIESGAASRLEIDSLLQSALQTLIGRHAAWDSTGPFRAVRQGIERNAVRRVREYLEAHADENITLDTLARLAQLSPYYLNRVFRAEVGVPPHAYQTQIRVERAKKLLIGGWSVGEAAAEAGFFDQSHLRRHFRRILGVSPGRYAIARTY